MSDSWEISSSVPGPSARAPRPVNVAMQHLPPPPPPPPPQAASSSVPRSSVRAPRAVNVAMQHLSPPPQIASSSVPRPFAWVPGTVNIAMQHLPLQPPPPPPVVPSSSSSQLHNPAYCDQSPQPSTSNCHPPTAVVMFDARRPPPPLHTHVQLNNNTLTRTMSDSCAAKPSKLRRIEDPKNDDAMCDVCVQRQISIENYRMQMEKLSSEDECQSLLLIQKQLEYQRHKDLLRSLVGSELFRKVEEFVELSQPVRAEDSLRQRLSAVSRPVNRSSPDLLHMLQDMLFNEDRSSSSERPGYSELAAERAHSSGSNGVSSFRPYSNGNGASPAYALATASAPIAPPAPTAPLPTPPTADAYPHYPTPPAAVAYPHYTTPPTDAYTHYPTPNAVTYPHYPPPRAYYPPSNLPGPRPSTSRAPILPCPPHAERYPPPYYY